MLRPTPAVFRLATSLVAALACMNGPVLAADAVDEARALLAGDDPRSAVDRLETALPETPRDRLPALLDVLRDAYERAAARADAEGKPRDAVHFHEGLKLLNRSRPAKPASKPEPEPEPAPPETPASPAVPEPERSAPGRGRAWPRKRSAPATSPARTSRGRTRAHVAAGRLWRRACAFAGKLPPQRQDHWAYCRLVEVLERINAGPASPSDWAEIHAEIDHIRLLSPKNWYSEYLLRNVVVERSGDVKRKDADKLVLRGASPDERPAQPQLARPKPTPRQAPRTVPARDRTTAAPAAADADRPAPATAEIGHPGPAFGNWKTYITPNFQIFHNDETHSPGKVAPYKAEAARREAAKRWTGEEPSTAWTPKCDLYLYPTAAIFAAETQQPPESPGFATAGLSNGRVTTRMVKLQRRLRQDGRCGRPPRSHARRPRRPLPREAGPAGPTRGCPSSPSPNPSNSSRARDLERNPSIATSCSTWTC